MTINIIIKTSHLANKKYDAIIDGKKTVPFGQNIKMKTAKIDIFYAIRRMKIGMILKQQDSGLKIFFGIRKQSQNQ